MWQTVNLFLENIHSESIFFFKKNHDSISVHWLRLIWDWYIPHLPSWDFWDRHGWDCHHLRNFLLPLWFLITIVQLLLLILSSEFSSFCFIFSPGFHFLWISQVSLSLHSVCNMDNLNYFWRISSNQMEYAKDEAVTFYADWISTSATIMIYSPCSNGGLQIYTLSFAIYPLSDSIYQYRSSAVNISI